MSNPPISAVTSALVAAEEARASVRGLSSDDPQRHAVLEAAKRQLTEAWTEEHTAYVKAGRQIGRTGSDDPVREAGKARRNELKRLRSALNVVPGTPRTRAPRPSRASMQGTIGRTHQTLEGIATEHEAIRAVLGSGEVRARSGGTGRYRSMAPLNEEAGRLLDVLAEVRADLNLKFTRYSSQVPTTLSKSDEIDAMRHRVELLRENCDILAAELRKSKNVRTPIARILRREPWTLDAAIRAVGSFHRANGRMPTAREMNADARLPHYTTTRRLLGEQPITKLDKIVAQATN